jgi:type I site-specific restriction endonuclease
MIYAKAAALMLPVACVATIAACASYPAPNERMATSEAALRSAQEVGAQTQPQAQLHAKLAQEEITAAKTAMSNGDNKRADYVLIRAKADAELALGEAREAQAVADATKAKEQVRALQQSLNQ